MQSWREITMQSFMQWTKLPKEIKQNEDDYNFLIESIKNTNTIMNKLDRFRDKLVDLKYTYDSARDSMDKAEIEKLNEDFVILRKIIDDKFDTSLMGVLNKWEPLSKEEKEKQMREAFNF